MQRSKKRKPVGAVTREERDEIRALHERRNTLTELFQTISVTSQEGNLLYKKVVADMEKTTAAFNRWWDQKGKAYKWEKVSGHSWEIDFDTGEVYLLV